MSAPVNRASGLRLRMKEWGLGIALCLVSLLFSGLLLEFVLRADHFRPSFELSGLKIVLDPDLLYRIKPRSREDVNIQGFRGKNFRRKQNNVKRIMFLGDSFIFASNVAERDSMPRVIERKLGELFEVYNFGVIGYGPDQSFVQLKKQVLQWKPDMVLLGIYPANDLGDIEENKIFSLNIRNGLARNPQNAVSPAFPPSQLLYWFSLIRSRLIPPPAGSVLFDRFDPLQSQKLFSTLFDDTYDLDLIDAPDAGLTQAKLTLMRQILIAFKQELDKLDIRLRVVIIPSMENIQNSQYFEAMKIAAEKYFDNEDAVDRICQEEGIERINLYPLLRQTTGKDFFDPADGHFSVEGYRFVAEQIGSLIESDFRTD